MKQPTPRELMQASIACLFFAGVALPWDPLLSGELLIAAGILGGVAAMPETKQSTNATRVSIADGVPYYPSASSAVLGVARLGSMRLGSL
jgi:hypothetical protein